MGLPNTDTLIATVKEFPPIKWWRWHRYERYFQDPSPDYAEARRHHGVYQGWKDAEQAIPGTNRDSAAAELIRVAKLNYREMYPRDYPVLFWVSTLLRKGIRIFDFGGSIGITYYTFSRFLTYPEGMQWLVFDQPEVVAFGRELATREGAVHLQFTTELFDLEGTDLLVACGSIHYIETPFWDLIARLVDGPKHIILNKVPITDGPSFVTLTHYQGGSIVPLHVFNRSEFNASIAACGYTMVDSWRNPEVSIKLPMHPSHSVSALSGFYFKRLLKPELDV